MLLMNPDSKAAKDQKRVPLYVYAGGEKGFTAREFQLAASDSEQIAVEDIY